MILLYLTCRDADEAEAIGRMLLEAKLVACVRSVPVSSMSWWEGKIEAGDEVLLMMESRKDTFESIEAKVNELHSYGQFVLTAVEVTQTNKGVDNWIDESLKS